MSGSRLVIVTPRYWPLVGDSERWVAHLASALTEAGQQVTVLTAQWEATWPSETLYQESRVVRLRPAPRGGWYRFRYARSVGRWLREHASGIDLVYCVALRYDAHVAIGALKKDRFSVVLRASGNDQPWRDGVPTGRRGQRLATACDAIIASTQTFHDALLSAGYDASRVYHIPDGAPLVAPRTAASCFDSRVALAEANHDLRLAEYAPLAVSVGRLCKDRNLKELVDAWGTVVARWPTARLWLLGDGPLRVDLYQRIQETGLQHQVLLPGTFDDLSEVFAAADVLAVPEATGDTSVLLGAMSAGIPIVAADTSENRALLDHGVHGLLIPAGNRSRLADAFEYLFEMPDAAAQMGAAGHRQVEQRFEISQVASQYLDLFERIVGENLVS